MPDKPARDARRTQPKAVSSEFNLLSFAWRLLGSLVLVLATYNPSGTSYFHWVTQADGLGPLHLAVGIMLLIGWTILWVATWRALETLGVVLTGWTLSLEAIQDFTASTGLDATLWGLIGSAVTVTVLTGLKILRRWLIPRMPAAWIDAIMVVGTAAWIVVCCVVGWRMYKGLFRRSRICCAVHFYRCDDSKELIEQGRHCPECGRRVLRDETSQQAGESEKEQGASFS